MSRPNVIPRRKGRRRAFTMTELVVATAVLALVAASVAVPMLGATASATLDAALRKALADAQYAQDHAAARQKPAYLKLAANGYELCERTTDGRWATLAHPIDKTPFKVTWGASATSAAKGVSMDAPAAGDPATIGFDALGAPIAWNAAGNSAQPLSSEAHVTLRHARGGLAGRVVVEAYTGRLRVEPVGVP